MTKIYRIHNKDNVGPFNDLTDFQYLIERSKYQKGPIPGLISDRELFSIWKNLSNKSDYLFGCKNLKQFSFWFPKNVLELFSIHHDNDFLVSILDVKDNFWYSKYQVIFNKNNVDKETSYKPSEFMSKTQKFWDDHITFLI